MAFRTVLDTQYRKALDTGTELKAYCQMLKSQMEAGPISGNVIIELYERLVADKVILDTAAATPGIATYAQSRVGDDQYDVEAEFTALIAAIVACGTWIANNVVSTGWVTFGPTGVSTKSFTSAQTSGLRAQLDVIIGAIE